MSINFPKKVNAVIYTLFSRARSSYITKDYFLYIKKKKCSFPLFDLQSFTWHQHVHIYRVMVFTQSRARKSREDALPISSTSYTYIPLARVWLLRERNINARAYLPRRSCSPRSLPCTYILCAKKEKWILRYNAARESRLCFTLAPLIAAYFLYTLQATI